MLDFVLQVAMIVVICVIVYIVMEKVYERIPPKLVAPEPEVTIHGASVADVEDVIKRTVERNQRIDPRHRAR